MAKNIFQMNRELRSGYFNAPSAKKPETRLSTIDGKVFHLTDLQAEELKKMAENFESANFFGESRVF